MKKLNKKSLVLLVCVALLLTCAVGSTVAYLAAGTEPLTNTFTPGKVTTEIDEKFEGKTKSSIVINNTGTVPVYVRVAIVANWAQKDADDNEVIVGPATADDIAFTLDTDWTKIGDYYYYTKPVAAGGKTSDLLGTSITSEKESPYLVITVLHQSIQAEPKAAVEEMWPVKVQDDKTLAERSGQ